MVTTTIHKAISTLYSSSKQHGKYYSRHFQGTGYGTSSSSVRILFILVPLFCDSMFDDICSSVVHSLPDSHFSLILPLNLSNHLILGIPLFLIFPSSFFLRMQCSSLLTICPYQFRILSWTSIAIYPTFGASIPYSFILYHVDLCNFPCISIVAISFIVPSAMSLPQSYHCQAGSHRIFAFIFCHPTLHRLSSSSSNRSARFVRGTSASMQLSSSNVDPR